MVISDMSISRSHVRMDLNHLAHFDDRLRTNIQRLITHDDIEFDDCYGNYKILRVSKLINYLENKYFKNIIIGSNIILSHDFMISENSKELLVIGSASDMSKAKEVSLANNLRLITIPTLLSNDAFATNRVDQEDGCESLESVYPIETVFVTDVLQEAPIEIHMLGIGEILSLYTSIIDYMSTESNCLSEKRFGELYFFNIVHRLLSIDRKSISNESIIISLIEGLVYKTLLMRFQGDHTIGAGIDHILSRVLEKRFSWSHGKSCILSLIVSLLLFPNWQCYPFTPDLLLNRCIDLGLINQVDIELIANMDFKEWANDALILRSNRKTCLKNLNNHSFNFAKERFRKL